MRFTLSAVAMTLALVPAHAAQEAFTLERPGGSLIHYSLDRPEGEPAGLIVIAQGSGCAPGATSSAMAKVRAAFADHAALIVEKIGVTPETTEGEGTAECPADFTSHYALTQRVEDYRLVLDALGRDESLLRPLVLFGGSEGGLAMAMLATHIDADATILLSSATGPSFGEMVKATVPPEAHPHFDAAFTGARANPDGGDMFGGYPYRFWASIIDLSTAELMAGSEGPFLVIQGGRDVSNPLALARQTVDDYALSGHCGLTYWEFPVLDHSMKGEDGTSHLAAVMELAAQWSRSPAPAC